MGVKGYSSNRRKNTKRDKTNKWHRAVKAERKKQVQTKQIDIEDIHLYSKEKLKNKLKNPQNSIQISGKKQRRLTKRLGHALREKSRMEVEEVPASKKKTVVQHDVVMSKEKAVEPEHTMESEALDHEAPSASNSSTGLTKKKRRGRKRNKNSATSKSSTGVEGKVDDGDDDWEDVEMEGNW